MLQRVQAKHALCLILDGTQEALLYLITQRLHLFSQEQVRFYQGLVSRWLEISAHFEEDRLDAVHCVAKERSKILAKRLCTLQSFKRSKNSQSRCVITNRVDIR